MTTKQKVGVGVGVFAAFALGFGSGAVASSADAEPTKESKSFVADLRPEVRDLEAQVENLEQEKADLAEENATVTEESDTLREQRDTARQNVDNLKDDLAAVTDERDALKAAAEEEPAPQPESSEPYAFEDVQVSEDFVGDFEVRARVTNNGDSVEWITFTASIFSGGSVVGTGLGFVENLESGETVTVTFTSLDAYEEWDEVEFQVDSAF